ncbi:MAG: M28 family peptidase [Planctomycetota bacterium]|nr:M28 family peptidase [Planctomycetota bacterium]
MRSRNACQKAIAFALTFVCASLLVPTSLAQTTTQPTSAPATQPTNAAAFHAIVAELAAPEMEGRGVGTAGIARARDRVAQWFTAAGLRPGVKSGGYLQPFAVDMGVRVVKQACEMRVKGVAKAARAETDFNAMGFSADGHFAGPLVFVGYGIEADDRRYDSYRGMAKDALRGKVAVAFRYEPMSDEGHSLWAARGKGESRGPWTEHADLSTKAHAAAKHGAEALLVVDPPGQRGATLKTTALSTGASAAIPVLHVSATWLEEALTRTGADGPTALREFQRRADKGAGPMMPDGAAPLEGLEVRGEVELQKLRDEAANIVGVLPGIGPLADRVILIGAHYDHLGYGEIGSRAATHGRPAIHPGADDNASGVAGLVLLARRLGGHAVSDAAGDARPRRTLVFVAFSGEERGLLGSRFLVDHLDQLGPDAGHIEAMINFDMIGRLREGRLYALGIETGDRWKSLISEANAATRLNLAWTWSGIGTSDNVSFDPAQIPAVILFTGLHEDYHRPTDTAEKINDTGAMKVIDLAQRLIEGMEVDPERVEFRRARD